MNVATFICVSTLSKINVKFAEILICGDSKRAFKIFFLFLSLPINDNCFCFTSSHFPDNISFGSFSISFIGFLSDSVSVLF